MAGLPNLKIAWECAEMQVGQDHPVRKIFASTAKEFRDPTELLRALQDAGRLAEAMLNHLDGETRNTLSEFISSRVQEE